MKRKIELRDKESRNEICEKLNISKVTLSLMLNFRNNSKRALIAREMALSAGGVMMEEKDASKPIKVIDAKGEVKKVINYKFTTV